jgi:hypothetical protein
VTGGDRLGGAQVGADVVGHVAEQRQQHPAVLLRVAGRGQPQHQGRALLVRQRDERRHQGVQGKPLLGRVRLGVPVPGLGEVS